MEVRLAGVAHPLARPLAALALEGLVDLNHALEKLGRALGKRRQDFHAPAPRRVAGDSERAGELAAGARRVPHHVPDQLHQEAGLVGPRHRRAGQARPGAFAGLALPALHARPCFVR